MKRTNSLGRETLEKIKHQLTVRLRELRQSLTEHEKATTEPLPPNLRESAAVRSDMRVMEAEEKLEADEIGLIESALLRIAHGKYGVCHSCQKPISKARLLAVPETSFCHNCKKNYEHAAAGKCWVY